MEIRLTPRQTPGSAVVQNKAGWRLEIPAGLPHVYQLAQLDNYGSFARKHFPSTPPWNLTLRVRVSAANLPGTWGFGLWNDPFGFSHGFGGNPLRFPSPPQAAWFMHASTPNWLSLQENPTTIPANGFFASTFRSPGIPSLLLLPGVLAFPLCAIRPMSRFIRRLAARIIQQDAVGTNEDVTSWHDYSIQWLSESCGFSLDGREILNTACSPHPPLGLVLWIDNQFATWTPEGKLGYGTLANPAAWIEIENLHFGQD